MDLLKELNRAFKSDYQSLTEASSKLIPANTIKAVATGDLEDAFIKCAISRFNTIEFDSETSMKLYTDFTDNAGYDVNNNSLIATSLDRIVSLLYRDSWEVEKVIECLASTRSIKREDSVKVYVNKRFKDIQIHREFLQKHLYGRRALDDIQYEIQYEEITFKEPKYIIQLFLLTLLLAQIKQIRNLDLTVVSKAGYLDILESRVIPQTDNWLKCLPRVTNVGTRLDNVYESLKTVKGSINDYLIKSIYEGNFDEMYDLALLKLQNTISLNSIRV